MLVTRAYKTQIAPTDEQTVVFKKAAGTARFVYNWILGEQTRRYEETKKHVPARTLKKELNALKKEAFPWMSEVPYTVLQEAAEHVNKAWINFFKSCEKKKKGTADDKEFSGPVFKRKPGKLAQTEPFTVRGVVVEDRRVRLPAPIGWIALKEFGYIPTEKVEVLSATVRQRAGRWFVSVQVREEIPDQKATGEPIGVDVGVAVLAVSSDGRRFENPKPLHRLERKIASLQRHSKKKQQDGSARHRKTQARIADLQFRAANIRNAVQHETSAALTGRHRPEGERPLRIVIEDLNVKGMLQNRRLAKSLSDTGLSELHRQIAYKAQWAGGVAVEADRWFASSKTCSQCGAVKKSLALSVRVYKCDACGLVMDRDENAARNLKAWVEKNAADKAEKNAKKNAKKSAALVL